MPQTILACGYDGIYRTTDGGLTWSHVYSAYPCVNASDADNKTYALVNSGSGTWSLIKSVDQGLTWAPAGSQSWSGFDYTGTEFNGYDYAGVINMGNNTLLVYTTSGIDKSTNDESGPWTTIYGGITGNQIVNTKDGNAVITSGYGFPPNLGLYFDISNYGSSISTVSPLPASPSYPFMTYCYGYQSIGGTQKVAVGDFLDVGTIFPTDTYGIIIHTTDNWATTTYTKLGYQQQIRAITTLSTGRLLSAAAYPSQIHYSDDNGITWTLLSTVPSIFPEALIEDDPGIVLGAYASGGIYRSSDGGATWAPVLTKNMRSFEVVEGPPISADFYAIPTSGKKDLTVDFYDLSSGDPTGWSWDFGDGSTGSTNQNPQHVYTIPGIYTVTLTITKASSIDTETKTDYITVTFRLYTIDEAIDTSYPEKRIMPIEGTAAYLFFRDSNGVRATLTSSTVEDSGFRRNEGPTLVFD